MRTAKRELPTDGYLVKHKHGTRLVRDCAHLLQEIIARLYAMNRLHDDRRDLSNILFYNLFQFFNLVVMEREDCAVEALRHSFRLKSMKQVVVELVLVFQIGGKIPIGPTVIPAERDDIPPRICASNAGRNGH